MMPDQEIYSELKLENQLCFPIYACSREITKMYQPLLDEIGVTYSQYLVLLVLWEQEQCTVKELGEALYLDSGTLTPLLKRMQTAGLIMRERSTSDERKVNISLTEKGWELREQARSIPQSIVQHACLKVEEHNDLLKLFNSLLQRVHQINAENKETAK